jgi:hypothetical protein
MKAVWIGLISFPVIWGLLVGLSKVVRISPDWALVGVAAGLALAVMAILLLYRYEAGAVTPRRARWIIGLRLAALAVLAWVLIEPVLVREVEQDLEREVVVVLDESGSMQLKDDGTTKTRLELGEAAMAEAKIVETLSEKMRVRTVRAARSVRNEGEGEAEGWADATDLAAALGDALEQVPPDELAGVLMLTDGRHNRPGRVEDVARRFGILDAPIGVVAVGSAEPPRDASILNVRAPDAIHLGDRMRVAVEAKFDGYKGKKAQVKLFRGEEELDARTVSIPQDHHREEVRFSITPEQGGVGDYRVEIAGLDGERFDDNNAWAFETSITDARTNVLLIESHPRWEFRYLRNLFYGRDKSVHLQHVLLNPDRIQGQEDAPVPASAGRPFGEALANRLPENEAEWRKFDVIIIGDVSPETMDAAAWEVVSKCVNERAALLVMVAGPRYMPHAIQAPAGRELVPAEIEYSRRNYFSEKLPAFRFGLTAEGRGHPVVQHSAGQTDNEALWMSFPEMGWRHPVRGVKEGAEVLLTAVSGAEETAADGTGLDDALDALAKRREREAAGALLVTRQTGKGKVALLLTDRTWRLREGAGDLHHHRFWGNLVRWGAGPTLRAGGSRARLGTDQLTYTPDDAPRITARLRDAGLNPVKDPTLRAEIVRQGKVVSTMPLVPVEGSDGLYEVRVPPMEKAGRYQVRLKGEQADQLVRQDGASEVIAGFRVVGSRGPIELAETTLNLPLLETIADLSGGKVVDLKDLKSVESLAALFLSDTDERLEVRETPLWDNPLVLLLLALPLAAEWILRRAGGLP